VEWAHFETVDRPIAGPPTEPLRADLRLDILFQALRENSEKWAIGGDFGVLPFLGFPQLASLAETTP
jgi:hypothetical protein